MTTARPSVHSPTSDDSRICFGSAELIRAEVRRRMGDTAVRLALSRDALRTTTQRSGFQAAPRPSGAAAG
jgi:hypothetical protein